MIKIRTRIGGTKGKSLNHQTICHHVVLLHRLRSAAQQHNFTQHAAFQSVNLHFGRAYTLLPCKLKSERWQKTSPTLIASNALLLPKVRLFKTSQPQVCICERRPRLTAKRFQNGRPACRPESRPTSRDVCRRTAVGETFRAVPACVLIGGAKGRGTSPLHGLKSKRQVVLETRSHDLPVLAAQLPVRVPQRPSLHLLGQGIRQKSCQREVSVQERICNISRAWPDSRLQQKAEVANPGPESEKPATLPPFCELIHLPVKWDIPGMLLAKSRHLLGGATFLLPGEPSAGWCTIKYLLAAVAKDQSTAACWQHIYFCCVLASKST
ncbi:uncharacterized protein [Syngnathus scovelli]|uniref:uncharacterized protein n=1 Tax=Syngnathus scovelli TaxID=161590 RepID=UPI0035CC47CB